MTYPFLGPINIIIPSAAGENASAVFHVLDPDTGGANTFGIALSASGNAPATHYACRTRLEEPTYNALKTMNATDLKAYCDQLAAERGRVAPNNVTAFKSGAVLDEGDFMSFIAAQGLKLVIAE